MFSTLSITSTAYAVEITNPFFTPGVRKTFKNPITLLNTPAQGSLVYGKVESDGRVYLNDQRLKISKDGSFIFALPTNAGDTLTLTFKKGMTEQTLSFPISARQWPEDRVDGLPPEKVTLSAADKKRVEQEARLIKKARQNAQSNLPLSFCFNRPVAENARVSSPFGARRILNGILENEHSAADYALPTGTPIYAPQDGVVIFTHNDLFYSGKTVLIDHGFGLVSSYSHLNAISVKPNHSVKKGEQIGVIGETGRANGPHLHLVFSWQDVRFDPETTFQNFPCD